MAQSYFIWNGIDCRSMGVIMRGPAPIVRAEERVKHVEIPGRAGDLTETEGTDIFNSYIQTVTISVRGGFRVREIYKWLRGSGYVTFSGEPNVRQKARVIGAITLNRISRNMDHWAGEVQFYCQPFKEKLEEKTVTIETANSGTDGWNIVRNDGDVTSRPRMIVTTSDTSFGITITGDDTPDSNTIAVSNITSGTRYIVDCDIMEVTRRSNGNSVTRKSTGVFPVMSPGENIITGSGWSKIEIDMRERYL